MPPEVIKNRYCNNKSDMWSIGVLMYIMLSGEIPFDGSDHQEIQKSILLGQYSINAPIWNEISLEAKDLLSKLLEVNLKKRFNVS